MIFLSLLCFWILCPLNLVFEIIRSFMRSQVEGLKKSFERFCLIGKWSVVVCSFRFAFVSFYRVSGDFKVSLWAEKTRHPKGGLPMDDIFITE